MEVKIKRLNSMAIVPQYAHSTDAGMDLFATSKYYDADGNVVYGTGLAFEIPRGYVGLVFPRSSNATKKLLLSNSVGVIDSGYRGEVKFKFKRLFHLDDMVEYEVGERVGQMIIMPYPRIEFVVVDELTNSERGTGGYGSTGK